MPPTGPKLTNKVCELCSSAFSYATAACTGRKYCSRSCAAKKREIDRAARGLTKAQATAVSRERLLAAVADINAGITWAEAARLHDITLSTLVRRAPKLGVRYRRGPRTAIRARTMRDLSAPEAAYLAGIIDGEGSVTIMEKPTYKAIVVSVTNTSEPLMAWLGDLCGRVKLRGEARRRGVVQGTKPIHDWTVTTRADALAVLEAVAPYMLVKKERAIQAIALLNEWIAGAPQDRNMRSDSEPNSV